MQKQLDQLTAKLDKTFGPRLVSVVLYGSAASGEFHQQYSDLNVLCVLREIRPAELAEAEPVFRWWRDLGNPAPLLLAADEVATSTDCFPIEFQDMQHRRKVLHGSDVIQSLVIDRSFYRAQVEYQFRAALIRLRQKAAGVLHDKKLLAGLMTDSVSTFLVLGRHVLLLGGFSVEYNKRDTIDRLAADFQIECEPFRLLMDLREKGEHPAGLDIPALFGRYLKSVQAVVSAVDALEK